MNQITKTIVDQNRQAIDNLLKKKADILKEPEMRLHEILVERFNNDRSITDVDKEWIRIQLLDCIKQYKIERDIAIEIENNHFISGLIKKA